MNTTPVTKKKLLISVSGGETSLYMAQYLWYNFQNTFEMIFVFANTGQKNEETLRFVQQCSSHFGFPIVWVECNIHPEFGVGTTHTIVDFNTASREGEPFEAFIAKYGIPNIMNPQCTRELKEAPIRSYGNEYFGAGTYYTAIGIRSDEGDRMNADYVKEKLFYPLLQNGFLPHTTKPVVNLYWSKMPFRLNLKGYQGNCKWCWKKSKKKLLRIAKDNPAFFDFPARMETKYGNYFPVNRREKWLKEGKELPSNITFFRDRLSAVDILNLSIGANPIIPDDSINYAIQLVMHMEVDEDDLDLVGGESCEVFSECR